MTERCVTPEYHNSDRFSRCPTCGWQRAVKLWRLDLICCGRADTHIVRDTWAEADEFRQSYVQGDGHDRQAILVEDHAHSGFCNGYSDGCPLPGGSFLEGAWR